MSKSVYIVATPIGNLGDLTFRALQTLKDVDIILAEDTRRIKILLDHYGIKTPAISYHKYNERDRLDLIRKLLIDENKSIALVSDAGTPLVSDPGWVIVDYSLNNQIPVIPIPGASSLTTHLSASGLAVDKVLFVGFLPQREKELKKYLTDLLGQDQTIVFFESPNRILDTLKIMAELSPLSQVVIGRELTKIHEEFIRFKASDIPKIELRGEFTVGVRGYKRDIKRDMEKDELEKQNKNEAKKISEILANYLGIKSKEAYNILNKIKKELEKEG
jgi:16S rRNA (cytidine1402-2'-O)-methyltransferase